jgi:hypothetical protein
VTWKRMAVKRSGRTKTREVMHSKACPGIGMIAGGWLQTGYRCLRS